MKKVLLLLMVLLLVFQVGLAFAVPFISLEQELQIEKVEYLIKGIKEEKSVRQDDYTISKNRVIDEIFKVEDKVIRDGLIVLLEKENIEQVEEVNKLSSGSFIVIFRMFLISLVFGLLGVLYATNGKIKPKQLYTYIALIAMGCAFLIFI